MMEARAVLYRTDRGVKPAVVRVGTKRMRVIEMRPDVRVRDVPITEEQFMRPLEQPLAEVAKAMRAAGKAHGITKTARRLLRGL